MTTETPWRAEGPGHYQIEVAGSLDPDWSDRLGGLSITRANRMGSPAITILEGELIDQGSLIGVLNSLYELRLPLLSVRGADLSEAR